MTKPKKPYVVPDTLHQGLTCADCGHHQGFASIGMLGVYGERTMFSTATELGWSAGHDWRGLVVRCPKCTKLAGMTPGLSRKCEWCGSQIKKRETR